MGAVRKVNAAGGDPEPDFVLLLSFGEVVGCAGGVGLSSKGPGLLYVIFASGRVKSLGMLHKITLTSGDAYPKSHKNQFIRERGADCWDQG